MDSGDILAYLLPVVLLLMGTAALMLRDLWRKDWQHQTSTLIYRILLAFSLLVFAAGIFLVAVKCRPMAKPPSRAIHI